MVVALRENPRPASDARGRWSRRHRSGLRDVKLGTVEFSSPELPKASKGWINVPFVPCGTLVGRRVPLVWFWDFPSLELPPIPPVSPGWHRRYGQPVCAWSESTRPQFDFGKEELDVVEAVREVGDRVSSCAGPGFEIWRIYGNEVWPALYLWDRRGVLRHPLRERARYEETETAIREALLHEIDDEAVLRIRSRRSARQIARVRSSSLPLRTPYLELRPLCRAPVAAGETALGSATPAAGAAAVLDGHGGGRGAGSTTSGSARSSSTGPRLYELIDTGAPLSEHELALVFEDAGARRTRSASSPAPPDACSSDALCLND